MQRTSSTITSTKRPTSRPSYSQTTRPSTLTGLSSSQKTLVSLSTLATAKTSASTSTTNTSTYRFSFGDASDNPFLEQPPRKQFKDAPTTSDTRQTSRQVPPKSQEPTTQQRLVLTRVLPINSPVRIPAAAPTHVIGSSLTTSTRLLPKIDYEHFLRKSTEQQQDSDATEESSRDAGGIGDTLKKSLRTTAMDIARKSIMQHAAASPRKTFLKVSEVAARSHGEPSLHDLLLASEADGDDSSMFSRSTKPASTQSFAHPDTQFTFESTPLPLFNSHPTAAKQPNTQHHLEDSEHGANTQGNYTAGQKPFDADTARDKDLQESSFNARESMAHGAAPYKYLSLNERESMRASRGKGFRARPIDPRVFTRAGDSGIPRVIKPPLTIPVSPVFSKRVRTKAKISTSTTTTTTKSSLRSGPIRTAAFNRLVNITNPSHKEHAGHGYQASGSNNARRPVDVGIETRQSSTILALASGTGPTVDSQTTSSTIPAQGTATAIYPSTTTNQQPRSIGSSALFRPPGTNLPRRTTLGPPLRLEGPSTTATSVLALPVTAPEKTASGAVPEAHSRKPVTLPIPFSFATDKLRKDGAGTSATTASRPGQPKEQPALGGMAGAPGVHSRKGVTHPAPFKFATDDLRKDEHGTTTSVAAAPAPGRTSGKTTIRGATAALVPHSRRPLTHPVPFKFATDDILRRRHVMFQSRGHSRSAATAASTAPAVKEKAKPINNGAFRRSQPLKRLTTPVPFHLATQRRAEARPSFTQHTHTLESAALASSRTPPRRSRLAGVFPVPTGHPIMTSSIRIETPHFVPTVPISPKLGRRVPVPSLRPAHFVLRKSTKELTQPHEFQFRSDQRAKKREEYEHRQSVRKREQELLDLQQKSDRIHQEREERMRLRESLERTFRARPITHYQPTIIHKATRPLTKPVSPMIGEKRKRYEMEQQYLEQQRQDEEHQEQQEHQQFGQSQNQHTEHYNDIIASPTKGSVPDQEIYRTFEEAKLLQARKQALQQQLTEQERRQVVLANSARATIHQPPIRLSFPMDPETEALQADEIQPSSHHHGGDFREYEALEQEPSSSAAMPEAASAADRSQLQPLPMVRDSFGGSNNHRLSRELRRISLEANRRTSGERGIRSRLSDNFSRRSASSAGSRKSGGEVGAPQDYYPFTRSQEPTGAPSTTLTGTRTATIATTTTPPASTTVPITTTTTTSAPLSAVLASTTSVATPMSLWAPTAVSTTTTAASTSTPATTTYRPATLPEQEKDERRRRSGSFIPLEAAVQSTSPSKSSRLSRLFGAPPVSSAARVYRDVKGSAATNAASTATSAAAPSLSRSKGPVVIEHTLSLSDL